VVCAQCFCRWTYTYNDGAAHNNQQEEQSVEQHTTTSKKTYQTGGAPRLSIEEQDLVEDTMTLHRGAGLGGGAR
jgi:hypothetical protein